MRARTVLFLKGISAAIFSLRSCTACAHVLSLCMRLPARAGPPATTAPALSATRRQRRKVDKCRVADKKKTDKPTDKHTLLFYRYRLHYIILYYTSRPCRTLFGYCPPPALGCRKADMKTLSFFFPTPYPCHVARKQLHHGRQSCLCPVTISFMS